MAKTRDKFRQSDVTFWGVTALACAGFAVLSANASALIPTQALSALHATRGDGGSMNDLRAKMAAIEEESSRLRSESSRLMTMLTLASESQGAAARRLGAIETTLPVLLEGASRDAGLDLTTTASVDAPANIRIAAEGGSVSVVSRPLFPQSEQPAQVQVMPGETVAAVNDVAALDLEWVSAEGYGLAMGPAVTLQDAFIAWTNIRNKVGALLIGLEPLLAQSGSNYHLVVGPVPDIAQTEQLCTHINRVGLQCIPVPYQGVVLPR